MSLSTNRRVLIIAVISVIYTISMTIIKIGFGNDYCPVYYEARLIIEGKSPYGSESSALLGSKCISVAGGAGDPYPLPFGLITAPLGLLPFSIAAFIWTLSGIFLAFCCFLLVEEWPPLLLLMVLFAPLFRSASISQVTLVWFGISILLLLAMERHWWWIVGLCIAILPWKPQASLLFTLAGCWWAWRTDRKALILGIGLNGLLVGLSFIIQPGWFMSWVNQLYVYNAVVKTQWWGLWAVPLILVCWRLPWWARLGILQFLLFPVNDPYAALPMILIWISISGWAALLGAFSSWLYPVSLQISGIKPWLVFILPVITIAGWYSWRQDLFYLLKRNRNAT